MSADEAREYQAPRGCRDPKLWATAENLLAVHNAEVAACVACRDGGPCTLVRSCVEAQDRAMQPFTIRWLRDDYLGGRFHERAVGRAKVRQCGASERRSRRWWPGWMRRRRRPR
jgi:hypothetical protein